MALNDVGVLDESLDFARVSVAGRLTNSHKLSQTHTHTHRPNITIRFSDKSMKKYPETIADHRIQQQEE